MSEPDDAAWRAAAGAPPSDDGFRDRDPGLPFEYSDGAPAPADFPGPEPGDGETLPPDHNAPDHDAPDHNAPDHNAPDHNAPDHNAPDHNAPDHNAPDHHAPDHHAPAYTAPVTDPSVAASSSPALRALRGRDPVPAPLTSHGPATVLAMCNQ
ncbi:MAG TPA: hypothetical protein VES60_16470, partial [Nakamurella sp.]|nr:hypothetical protein [Nakamurella sp.]